MQLAHCGIDFNEISIDSNTDTRQLAALVEIPLLNPSITLCSEMTEQLSFMLNLDENTVMISTRKVNLV